jgi:2-methylcitrate dehydratase PrpD
MKNKLMPAMAQFFAGLTLHDLSPEVIERTKVCILDAIAAAYAGHRTEPARIGFDITAGFPTDLNPATVWIKGLKANYVFAAATNCLLVHNMIHDDMNQSSRGHAGNLMVPVVFAMAEAFGKPGVDVIPAVVAGYEAMGRVSAPAAAHSIARGFRGTSTYGPFGVAAAAAKILGLDASAIANAMACSASFSLGLLEPFNMGSMEWRFQNCVVVMGGIWAALAAEQGASAAASALEGHSGFLSAFCGNDVKEEVAAAWMAELNTLGQEYDITRTYFKPYSTCGYNQIGCNIALNLIKKHAITTDMLDEIIVTVSPDNRAYPGVDFHGPFESADQALLSKPFMLGAAVVTKDLQIETYENRLNDPEILKVAKMVRMEVDAGMSSMDTRIQFITKTGQVFTGDLAAADFTAFILDKNSAVAKFHSLAGEFIDDDKINEISDMVFHLEELKDISVLTKRLTL